MSQESKLFERLVSDLLCQKFKEIFFQGQPLLIGFPPKKHRFDLVNKTKSVVVECKNIAFTKSGNVPSAKISTLNEAAYFLSFLPNTTTKIIAIKRSERGKRETLAEYYYRTNRHLLNGIDIYEIDKENKRIFIINELTQRRIHL